jgi:hypothetical protein
VPGGAASTSSSPWQRALGAQASQLHPRLGAYFSAIPSGSIGRGSGTFDVVGTPRRWVRPALRVLARRRILFPVWERDVPFTVENRAVDGEVRAVRTFRFAAGSCEMVDAVAWGADGLVDRLGDGGVLRARFSASVVDGALELVSTSARWGRLPIPFAPTVRLIERFDDAVGRQHVSFRLDAPVVGRIYEYAGYFDYRVEAV